jgi:hypothetical protein
VRANASVAVSGDVAVATKHAEVFRTAVVVEPDIYRRALSVLIAGAVVAISPDVNDLQDRKVGCPAALARTPITVNHAIDAHSSFSFDSREVFILTIAHGMPIKRSNSSSCGHRPPFRALP